VLKCLSGLLTSSQVILFAVFGGSGKMGVSGQFMKLGRFSV
jgi:hypothetical protein